MPASLCGPDPRKEFGKGLAMAWLDENDPDAVVEEAEMPVLRKNSFSRLASCGLAEDE